jgi:hypothetical protein
MMDIIVESVKKIENLAEHSGCTDAGVLLDVNPDAPICQFEQGATMSAAFGGRSAVFTTYEPMRARTKISFMFGASLDTPASRGAAAAIINAILGFLCMSRTLHSCPATSHADCREELVRKLAGKKLFCIGSMGRSGSGIFSSIAENPTEAEIILISGDGLIAEGTGDIIGTYKNTKRIICIGPSTAGVAHLSEIEHWCPYGRSCPD